MPAAAPNPATCTQCGTTAPMHMMLMNDQGALTCGSCQAKGEAQVGMRKRAKNAMLAPAMLSTLAYFSFLVPVLNLAGPGVLAAIAIWGAVGAIRLHGELGRTRDHGVSNGLRSGLLVMSILTVVFAAFPLLMQVLAWVGFASMSGHHQRPPAW